MTEKRNYDLSEKALAQRREAAKHSTGPRTEAGKAASSRNGWKHGRYSAVNQRQMQHALRSLGRVNPMGKPCQTTCPKHPDNPDRTVAPCSLVQDGLTQAGGDCLDKEVFVDAFDSIMAAMETGEMDGMHGLLASEIAGAKEILSQLREEIAEHGMVKVIPVVTKEGEPVYDAEGNFIPAKIISNPALIHYTMLLDKLGLEFSELLVTPRSRQRAGTEQQGANAIQEFLGTMGEFAGGELPAPGRVIEHEAEEGEDA